ncbi:hypothetical protein H0H81_011942, partial [Sphagnurus paluster]
MQQLEQKIAELQDHIKTLESPGEMLGVALYNPYTRGDSPRGPVSRFALTDIPSTFPEDSASNAITTPQARDEHEPPTYEKRTILDTFFNTVCYAAARVGFFLDPKPTVDSMLHEPVGDPDHPTPALTHAIYLWGYHLSRSSSSASDREQSLKQVKYFLSEDLTGAHPHKVLHTIQAEVLLAHYYLSMGNVRESSRHAGDALGLALAAGLHRAVRDGAGASSRPMLSSTSSLGQSENIISRSQRIDAFWAVHTINVYLAVIQGPGATYSLELHAVDVPWPVEEEGSGPLSDQRDIRTSYNATILEFLDGKSTSGLSGKALHAKAVVLLEKAATIHVEGEYTFRFLTCIEILFLIDAPVDEHQERSTTNSDTGFSRLDTLIMDFQRSLPSITPSQASRSSVHLHITTHMLVYTALIKLHSPFVSSLTPGFGPARRQCIYATQAIAELTRIYLTYGSESSAVVADPIIGLAWGAVYELLLLLAAGYSATDKKDGCPPATFEAFYTILNALNVYSEEVPLL